ncbi:MAG: gamma-glutamylcyclotransferase [Chitinophagales bacterium]|nr:gamma-glutamylcyclotransferase [Chitinophagales bacterium]
MSDYNIYPVFVYGSLRSGFKSPAYEYISRYFTLVSEARVKGKLMDLGSYPAGIPADDDSFIVGELYDIKRKEEFDWAISQLDDYEGVNVEADEMQLYRRELTDVYFNDTVTKAWIYWYNGDVSGKPVITSGDLISYFQQKR